MPLDPHLVAGWNAYPRCIYHMRLGFIYRASRKPFRYPEATQDGPNPPENGPTHQDELQFIAEGAGCCFPFLLVAPGLMARRREPGYSTRRLAQLLQIIFTRKVHASTVHRWLQTRREYWAAKGAAATPRPRGRPRKAAPPAPAAARKPIRVIDATQALEAAKAEQAAQAEGPDPAAGVARSGPRPAGPKARVRKAQRGPKPARRAARIV